MMRERGSSVGADGMGRRGDNRGQETEGTEIAEGAMGGGSYQEGV